MTAPRSSPAFMPRASSVARAGQRGYCAADTAEAPLRSWLIRSPTSAVWWVGELREYALDAFTRETKERSASRRTIRRWPSCLISWIQPGPAGTLWRGSGCRAGCIRRSEPSCGSLTGSASDQEPPPRRVTPPGADFSTGDIPHLSGAPGRWERRDPSAMAKRLLRLPRPDHGRLSRCASSATIPRRTHGEGGGPKPT
jgi:hypothetical protein